MIEDFLILDRPSFSFPPKGSSSCVYEEETMQSMASIMQLYVTLRES